MLLRNQDMSKSPAVSSKVTGRLRTPRDGQKQVGIVIDSLPSHVTISDTCRQGHHCLYFSLKNKPTVLQACYALVSSQQSVCALLDEGRRVKGLITAADIVEKVLAQRLNPARILCTTIMRKDLMTLVEGPDKGSLEMRAAEIMLRGSLDYLAVADSQNRFLRTLFLGDLLSGPPTNCKTRTSVTPKPYAQEPKTRRIPDFLKTKVEVFQHNLRFIVARGSTFGGDETSNVFPETTTLEEIAIWMHRENTRACLVSSNGLFVLKDESLLKAITLGFDLKRTLVGEAVPLLSLPNVVSYTTTGRISARQALLLMRKYQDEYIVLVKKQTGSKCLVSRLEATRKELQKLQARRMLRKDLLRHVSFRPQASLPHLIRLPSGKVASLPLQTNTEIPLPSVRSRRQLEKAEECIARSDFNEALRNYTQYLQRNPQDSRVYMRRGILLQNQLQNQEEAISDFRAALSTNHLGEQEKREALILLCIGCLEINQFQDAQRIWREYALHRDEVVSHGVLKFAMSSFQHLHEDALDIISRTRSYEKALKIIDIALRMNEFARIASESVNVECPEVTSEIQKKEADLLVTRARCKQRLALVDDALLDCRKALDLVQNNRMALQLLVETERACELELRVNEITRKMGVSNSAELFLDRARIEYEQGCYVQAMKDFRSATRADCTCWLESDEKAFVEVARESDELHDTLSCYIENNLLQKITKMIELCGQYAPGLDAAIYRFLEETVLLYRKRGMEAFSSLQFRPAMDQFSKAIAICEQFEPVKNNLKEECSHLYITRAGCLMGFKEMQQALDDCENAIVLNPMNEKAWTRKCSCLQSMDDHDGFVRTAVEAKKLFGNSNTEVAELVARALAIVPLEAEETSFVTSDDVFAHM